VRRAALASIALAAVLALAGCGGSGSSQSQQSQRRPLNADDLLGIVPIPTTPAGANYNIDDHSSTFTISDYRQSARTKQDRALAGALGKAGLSRVYQRSFIGALNQTDASVFLFRNTAGASSSFARLRRTLQKPGAVNQKVSNVAVAGLGSQAWGGHLTGAGEDSGIVLWRNGNVLVVTDMQCDDKCDFDVAKAARAYATQIDELVDQSAKSS
jgi:hypothetical protein